MDSYTTKGPASEAISEAKKYLSLQQERMKLEVADRLISSLSTLLGFLFTAIFLSSFFLLFSIAAGIAVFQLSGSWIWSVTTSLGLYIVVLPFIPLVRKKWIEQKVFTTVWDALANEENQKHE